MAMFEQMRANVGKLLKGIDRYNPENLATLERYVETQAKENAYDLEANLAVLKLYQFNPAFFQTTVTAQILLKALTNLPHTDFTLCKCMIDQAHQEERPIRQILYLGDLLETCHFQAFWQALDENMDLLEGITGFEDSVRKFICHVVGITYQHIDRWLLAEMLGDLTDSQLKVWMSKYGWSADESGQIFICSQEESIKPKNIVEKIDFDSEWCLQASGCGAKEMPFDRPRLGPPGTWVVTFWFRARRFASARLHGPVFQASLLREGWGGVLPWDTPGLGRALQGVSTPLLVAGALSLGVVPVLELGSWVEILVLCFLAARLWASDFTSLCLSFLI
uniref:eukaryotic translation initiation factor 3 subunit K n=1 Tax=Panthera onca TaxID=9690 RepID=UPI002955708B|nr:eukaryotic translation initiation factor 3 subunit K [Panthera onca]